MSASRRTIIQSSIFPLAVSLIPFDYAGSQIAVDVALNRAIRFQAFSQRCAKAYCQLQQEVMPQNARDVIASTQKLMQVSLASMIWSE